MSDSHFILSIADDGIVQEFTQAICMAPFCNYDFNEFFAMAIASLEELDDNGIENTVLERSQRLYAQLLDKNPEDKDGSSSRLIVNAWVKMTCAIAVFIETIALRNEHGRLDYYFQGLIEDDIHLTRYEN